MSKVCPGGRRRPLPFLPIPLSLAGWKQAGGAKLQRLGVSLDFPSVLPTEQGGVVWPMMDEEGLYPSLPAWAQGWFPGPVAGLSVLQQPFWPGPLGALTRNLPYNWAQFGEPGWAQGKEAGAPPLPPWSAPLSSSLLPGAGPSHLAASGSARSCGVASEETAGVPHVPGCSLCSPPPLRSIWGGTFMHFVSPSQLPPCLPFLPGLQPGFCP